MLYKNVKALCDANGISIHKLELELKFNRGTIDKWKATMPGADRVQKVADYFKVTVKDLLNIEEKQNE